MRRSSVAKSAYEKNLKRKRDNLKFELTAKKRRRASMAETKEVDRKYQNAASVYTATERPGKQAGVAVYLK